MGVLQRSTWGVLQRSSWGKHWESTCKSSCKSSYKTLHHRRLGFLLATLLLVSLASPAHGQGGFGNFIHNLFRPIMRPLNNFLRPINFGLRDIFHFGPRTNAAFRAEGRDKLFPDDCGRLDDGKGALCFGDPALCRERTNLAGVQQFGGHNYYFSWLDEDARVRNTKWDWFNARNYCRKRCMDLVSFETEQEYDWVKGFIDGGVKFFWTTGRKCNFYGDGIKWHDVACHHEKPVICEDEPGHLRFVL